MTEDCGWGLHLADPVHESACDVELSDIIVKPTGQLNIAAAPTKKPVTTSTFCGSRKHQRCHHQVDYCASEHGEDDNSLSLCLKAHFLSLQ